MASLLNLRLNKSPFVKHTLTLVSGTIIAQAISFVSLIILQRFFFTPADFGILTFFTSFCNVFIAMSTFKYEYAIVMAKDDTEALNLSILSGFCVVLISILSFPIVSLFPTLIGDLPIDYTKFFVLLVPIMILAGGIYDVLVFWNNRRGSFKTISIGRILQNSSMEISRFSLMLLVISGKTLILGRVFGHSVSVVFLGRSFFRSIWKNRTVISWKAIRRAAWINKDFPLFTMPTIIVNNLTTWLFVYLFYDYYGSNSTGVVSVAIQYIALPFGILSNAFSQVFYKKIAGIDNKQVLLNLYKKFSLRLFLLGIVVVIIIFSTPEALVVWILGPNWKGIGVFMKTAVVWQTIAFAASSLSFIYTRLMKQRLMIIYAMLQLLLVYVSLYFGNYYFANAEKSFMLFVFFQSVYYAGTIVLAFYWIVKSKILN